jgi:hypothetical protein
MTPTVAGGFRRELLPLQSSRYDHDRSMTRHCGSRARRRASPRSLVSVLCTHNSCRFSVSVRSRDVSPSRVGWRVQPKDLDQPFRRRRADPPPCPFQDFAHRLQIAGVATRQPASELPDRLRTPEALTGQSGIFPPQQEVLFRRAEAAAKQLKASKLCPHAAPGIRTRLTTS